MAVVYPIKMTRRDDVRSIGAAGEFCWDIKDAEKRTLVVGLPDDKAERGFSITRWSIGYKNASNAQWTWNGDEDRPTLHPSMNAVGMWHGYCRDGALVLA